MRRSERELAAIDGLLRSARLLTLTGPGGVRKTRLALECFPDGVWLVDLAPLADASLIPSVTALTLGLAEDPSRPVLDRLADRLHAQAVLLVLDNCEHLIGGRAELADHLLRSCPSLRILPTSREALKVPGEAVWPVPPLSPPKPERAVAKARISEAERQLILEGNAESVLGRSGRPEAASAR